MTDGLKVIRDAPGYSDSVELSEERSERMGDHLMGTDERESRTLSSVVRQEDRDRRLIRPGDKRSPKPKRSRRQPKGKEAEGGRVGGKAQASRQVASAAPTPMASLPASAKLARSRAARRAADERSEASARSSRQGSPSRGQQQGSPEGLASGATRAASSAAGATRKVAARIGGDSARKGRAARMAKGTLSRKPRNRRKDPLSVRQARRAYADARENVLSSSAGSNDSADRIGQRFYKSTFEKGTSAIARRARKAAIGVVRRATAALAPMVLPAFAFLLAFTTLLTSCSAILSQSRGGGGYATIVATAWAFYEGPSTYDWGGPHDAHGNALLPRTTSDDTDCSGLTYFCYRSAGVEIPRQSESIRYDEAFEVVGYEQAVAGDVIWWPGHVAIYIGDYDGDGVGDCIEHGGPQGARVRIGTANRMGHGQMSTFLHYPGLEGAGGEISIPQTLNGHATGTYATYEFDLATWGGKGGTVNGYITNPYLFPSGTTQRAVQEKWKASGAVHDAQGFCKIGSSYLIACTSTFGQIGDRVTWHFGDGTTLDTIIVDHKSQTVFEYDHNPANRWGHDDGRCILEFCGTTAIGANPYMVLGKSGSTLVGATNNGSIL